ncbi:MAG: glycosyltransferase family 2 protein [Muribaculaceae bacterium]|nr:glycosyltransferase family 2 protein [Muribaculaceae bacterium]
MWVTLYFIFSYVIFFYTLLAMSLLLYLSISSIRYQRRLRVTLPDDETIRYSLKASPLTPKVSVIASAYNEEVTIKDNVYSLLKIDYPDYDIIIVNDESTDNMMDVMIEEFKLVPVPFTNLKRVPSQEITAVYKSTDERFKKLTVVDKLHAGTKSDGINAGINITDSPYFINTDVDCIVEPMAIYRMMWLVINSHVPMIGVGATMLMLNGCKVEDGVVTKAGVANNPLPWFQQLEYMRSFLIGKMGWIANGALPNISGGFGLFNTDVVVKSGGYDPRSFAEDVDMLLRMVTYMKNTGQPYRLGQIPQVCCWTEGPFLPHSIYRQRIRWARGLFEIVSNHRKMFFNPSYGVMGTFTLPYLFFFEFIAPLLELGGFIFMIWLIYTGRVNWNTTFIIFFMIFIFSISLSFVVLVFDFNTKAVKWRRRWWSYIKLSLAGIFEPIIYHPFITLFSIIGYFNHLRQGRKEWKQIQRSGAKEYEDRIEETGVLAPDLEDGGSMAPGMAGVAGAAVMAGGAAAAARKPYDDEYGGLGDDDDAGDDDDFGALGVLDDDDNDDDA